VPDYDLQMYVNKKNKTNLENSLEILREVLPLLKEQESFANDALFEALKEYAAKKEYKVGKVMWPVRVALSGKQMTPGGATEIMQILGKETSIERIETAVRALEQAAE
jgi:glutamyl-tRNA synthetase